MEQADQTLHDFVLNLLSDTQSLAAFEQDPAAVLDHAGLSDISAADVQEVIPLVVDIVPAHADALDAVLSQLPVDSLDTGQLGAIQQLQFVTQALGGIPAFDGGGALGNGAVNGVYHLTSDGQGGVWGLGQLESPLASGAASVTGDLEHGLTASVWDDSMAGHGTAGVTVPGVDMASAFSAMGDMSDLLDGQTAASSLGNTANSASTLLSGAAEMATGAVANPGALMGALSDPTAAVSALTGTAESYAAFASQSLPAPAGDMAGGAVQTVNADAQSVVNDVTSNVQTGPVGNMTSHLPVGDMAHGVDPVSGVVGQVTDTVGGHLPDGGGLSGVTSAVSDPTHAVQSTLSTVQSTVSDTVGHVASHSAVSDVTSSTGAGNLLGSGDHTDVTGDLSHVTSDLHLPSLF
jgi:hypothetical protein